MNKLIKMEKIYYRNNKIPKEFDIILRNKKNVNINTVDFNSFSIPHDINEIKKKIKKININNLPPLYRKKKMIKSISSKDIKSSVAKIDIVLDENSIPDDVKIKSSIQYIIDLIKERKKNIIKENKSTEEDFEKQRKLLEYFDKLPEFILNKVQNKINNYYKNHSEENDIITKNISELFKSPIIKYKFFEKVINSITHRVNFIDFNTYESYEREVINTINNEFTKLISIGNQIVQLNFGPYDNSIRPKYIFSVDKFFEKYDSDNNKLLKNKEKSLSMSNFRKAYSFNNKNVLNKNNKTTKRNNDIDEIYNLLKKDISIETKQKLKEEELVKFNEMKIMNKKTEINDDDDKIFKEKYQNIEFTDNEENEILKSKNSNFIKPIYKSNSTSFYNTRNNLNKINSSDKRVNHRNNNLDQKKNKDKTKSTMLSSIDYSNEKEKIYSTFRNYYNESLNKSSRRKNNEYKKLNTNIFKKRNINLINRKYFKNLKNIKGSCYSNFSKEKKKKISKTNDNNLNNEEEKETKKSNLDLLLEKIDFDIKLLEFGKKNTEEDEKKKLEEKNKKLEDEKKKKDEKERKKNVEDESFNDSFDIFTKQIYLKFQRNKILLKDLNRKYKSEEKNYIRKKLRLAKEFNRKFIPNSQNNSFIKKDNIKKRKSKIYLRRFKIFDNVTNEEIVLPSSYRNSKLYEFKKTIRRMKKITIEEYLNYLKKNISSIKLFNEPNSEEKRINQFIENLNDELETQQIIYKILSSKCKVIDKELLISSSIPFTSNIK